MKWDLPALLPIREEGVLRIFIALKTPLPWPGSNLQPLGLLASTVTTAPPRQHTMGSGFFPGPKVQPGCDADHSPPSSAKVKNE
jgi:hypothetical protein